MSRFKGRDAADRPTDTMTLSPSPSGNSPKAPSFSLHFLAGGIGGTVGAAILCPLEVAKTRLQSSLYNSSRRPPPPGMGQNPFRLIAFHMGDVVSILRDIAQREGIPALWKGLGPNLVGVVPARAIYFASYSQGKHVYAKLNSDNKETPAVHMLSAASAGTATALFTNPIWVAKTRVQLQSKRNAGPPRYKNSLHCMSMIVKEEGIRGLYKGLSASILGLSESTLQFVTYEYLKGRWLASKREAALPGEKVTLAWSETFASAATAKLLAAVITYPHEVLRTRLRQAPENGIQKYKTLLQTFRLILREEGVPALYGGMTAHLMRVVPNAAILFFCYELIVNTWS